MWLFLNLEEGIKVKEVVYNIYMSITYDVWDRNFYWLLSIHLSSSLLFQTPCCEMGPRDQL